MISKSILTNIIKSKPKTSTNKTSTGVLPLLKKSSRIVKARSMKPLIKKGSIKLGILSSTRKTSMKNSKMHSDTNSKEKSNNKGRYHTLFLTPTIQMLTNTREISQAKLEI